MGIEYDSWSTYVSESPTVNSVVPRVTRLTVAVLIAIVALLSLCAQLSDARRLAQAGNTPELAEFVVDRTSGLCVTTGYMPTRCRRPMLDITKQLDPANPDAGDLVTITFTITGLGVKQVDAVLLQDVSGSMREDCTPNGQTRLEVAKAAAIAFVETLSESTNMTNRVAVVAYNDSARVILPLTEDADRVIDTINHDVQLSNRRTNVGASIQAGYSELITGHWRSKAVKAMILLSDGWANEPITNPAVYARDWATAAGQCGIMIYTIGLGQEVSHTLMQEIADLSGGEYYSSADGSELDTIYREIALELRNLEITDVLTPGVDLDCGILPDVWQCITGSGFTTITIPISNNEIVSVSSLSFCFTVTVDIDPGYVGPINTASSEICYDGPGVPPCQSITNPIALVEPLPIDLAASARVVRPETEVAYTYTVTNTNRTRECTNVVVMDSNLGPVSSVPFSIPSLISKTFIATTALTCNRTSMATAVGCLEGHSGTVSGKPAWTTVHVIDGISLSVSYTGALPEYNGDPITLSYSVINLDKDDGIVSGTVSMADELSGALTTTHFGKLGPASESKRFLNTLVVSRDHAIALTAIATDDIEGALMVSSKVTLPLLCPEDTYEQNPKDDERPSARCNMNDPSISAGGVPQLRDFSETGPDGEPDTEWMCFSTGETPRLYTFVAHPLAPQGVAITMSLYSSIVSKPVISKSNLEHPTLDVRFNIWLPSNPGGQSVRVLDRWDYHLQVEPAAGQGGCWTDYELWVEEMPVHIWLPVVFRYLHT